MRIAIYLHGDCAPLMDVFNAEEYTTEDALFNAEQLWWEALERMTPQQIKQIDTVLFYEDGAVALNAKFGGDEKAKVCIGFTKKEMGLILER